MTKFYDFPSLLNFQEMNETARSSFSSVYYVRLNYEAHILAKILACEEKQSTFHKTWTDSLSQNIRYAEMEFIYTSGLLLVDSTFALWL